MWYGKNFLKLMAYHQIKKKTVLCKEPFSFNYTSNIFQCNMQVWRWERNKLLILVIQKLHEAHLSDEAKNVNQHLYGLILLWITTEYEEAGSKIRLRLPLA